MTIHQLFLDNIPEKPYNVDLFPYKSFKKNQRKLGFNPLISNLIYEKNKIPQSKIDILDKILDDCSAIYTSLLPLYQLGMHFSLALAGGAVRDILLGNENKIKDLDIVLSIRPYETKIPSHSEMLNTWGFNSKLHPWNETFIEKDNNKRSYKRKKMQDTDKIYEIVKFIIGKNNSFEKCFPPFKTNSELVKQQEETNNSEYLSRNLNGVLKINTNNLNYPVDILITNKTVHSFVELFDFNICKASFLLVNEKATKQKYMDFPKTTTELIKKYIPNPLFLKDVFNKQISIDALNRTALDVKRSIDSHLPRILKKYENYTLNFKIDEYDYEAKEKNVIINHYLLNREMHSKESDSLPIKILKI